MGVINSRPGDWRYNVSNGSALRGSVLAALGKKQSKKSDGWCSGISG